MPSLPLTDCDVEEQDETNSSQAAFGHITAIETQVPVTDPEKGPAVPAKLDESDGRPQKTT